MEKHTQIALENDSNTASLINLSDLVKKHMKEMNLLEESWKKGTPISS